MDFRTTASSNFLSNIVSETGSKDIVDCLVRLQAEAAGDDFLHDLGGAAEDGRRHRHHLGRQNTLPARPATASASPHRER
jgi:hypothetical protein